jgi:hypothetical protein
MPDNSHFPALRSSGELSQPIIPKANSQIPASKEILAKRSGKLHLRRNENRLEFSQFRQIPARIGDFSYRITTH